MNIPPISIVTPSFNQGKFLEQTIQSVVHQRYPNLEYVIIDGGSRDNSVEIIKKYEPQLHFWVSERDHGHGHALNKGFSHTRGEIMAWLNADDKYLPWSLNVVAEIFTQFPHVMWITGFNSRWNRTGAMIRVSKRPKNIYDYLLGNYRWIQQESVFWRRELWDKAGGYINQEYKFMVDGELWTRFFLHAELYSVDCILGGFRMHSENRSKRYYQSCLQEMEKAISIMRSKCSGDVLKNYARLHLFQGFKKIAFFKHLPITRLGRNFFPMTFKDARYRNIAYQNDTWTEQFLPFVL